MSKFERNNISAKCHHNALYMRDFVPLAFALLSHLQHQRKWAETRSDYGKWWNCGYVAASRSSSAKGARSFWTDAWRTLLEQARCCVYCIDLKWPQASWFYSTFAVFRCQYEDLQERKTCISNKESFLAAKIMEVKETLAEVKNANTAGKGRNWMSKAVLKHSSLNNSIFVCQQHKLWSKYQVNQREIRGNPSEIMFDIFLKYLE